MKNVFRITATIVLLLLLTLFMGCTYDTKLSEDQPPVTVTCRDKLVDEVFSFDSTTVRDARIGILTPSSFYVTLHTGETKYLNSDMQVFLDCTTKPLIVDN